MEEEEEEFFSECDFIRKYGYEVFDGIYKKRKGGGGV